MANVIHKLVQVSASFILTTWDLRWNTPRSRASIPNTNALNAVHKIKESLILFIVFQITPNQKVIEWIWARNQSSILPCDLPVFQPFAFIFYVWYNNLTERARGAPECKLRKNLIWIKNTLANNLIAVLKDNLLPINSRLISQSRFFFSSIYSLSICGMWDVVEYLA